MLRRFVALLTLILLPAGAAFALPDAAAPATPATVTGALLDTVTKTAPNPQTVKAQAISNYNVSFHDDRYQYTFPLCAEPSLVEVDGRLIDPAAFIKGDTLTVSIKPNTATPAKACVERIVRQKISRGSSGGECLQDYQVKREIEGTPDKLLIQTNYVYLLSIYARPTLDCDGKAYGSAPITTVVAPNQPFVVTLTRDTPDGQKELKRWSLTTDAGGKASFDHTFAVAAASYTFTLTPGTQASPGDQLTWKASVVDPHPSPSPASGAGSAAKVSSTPIFILLGIVLAAAAGAEYWHWLRRRRAIELPEQEYNRIDKL
jgi:hypothetical protein